MGEVISLVDFKATKELQQKTARSREMRLQLRSHFSEVDDWLHDTINLYIDQAVLRNTYSFPAQYGASIHENFNRARDFSEAQKCRTAQRQFDIVNSLFEADVQNLSAAQKHGLLMMAYIKGTVEERMVAALRTHPKVEAGLPVVYDFTDTVTSASWATTLKMCIANIRPVTDAIDDSTHDALNELTTPEQMANYYRLAQPRRYAAYVANNLAAGYYEIQPHLKSQAVEFADMPDLLASATAEKMIELARQEVRPEELCIWAGSAVMYSQIEAECYIESLD